MNVGDRVLNVTSGKIATVTRVESRLTGSPRVTYTYSDGRWYVVSQKTLYMRMNAGRFLPGSILVEAGL